MKTLRIVLLTMFILLGVPTAAAYAQPTLGAGLHLSPSGPPTMDIGLFYDDLAPYGYWVDRPAYGWAWAPRDVAPAWRPYTDGHWAWTDRGWTWLSDEPFGWATYHYGRWVLDPAYGWLWVPGNEWAPAWVSWRETDDYIGWAPLAPRRVEVLPASYVFVPARQFLAPDLFAYAVPVVDSVRIFPRTRTVTTYRFVNRRFVNLGVPVTRVERLTGRPVPRYQVVDLSPDLRLRGARIDGNRVALFRPQVKTVRVAPPPGRPVARGAVMTPRNAAALKAARLSAVETDRQLPRALRDRERGGPDREIRSRSDRKAEGRKAEGRQLARRDSNVEKKSSVDRRSSRGPERRMTASEHRTRREVRQRPPTVRHRELRTSQRSPARREISRQHRSGQQQRMRPSRIERHKAGPGPSRGGGHARDGGGKRKPPTRR